MVEPIAKTRKKCLSDYQKRETIRSGNVFTAFADLHQHVNAMRNIHSVEPVVVRVAIYVTGVQFFTHCICTSP